MSTSVAFYQFKGLYCAKQWVLKGVLDFVYLDLDYRVFAALG